MLLIETYQIKYSSLLLFIISYADLKDGKMFEVLYLDGRIALDIKQKIRFQKEIRLNYIIKGNIVILDYN